MAATNIPRKNGLTPEQWARDAANRIRADSSGDWATELVAVVENDLPAAFHDPLKAHTARVELLRAFRLSPSDYERLKTQPAAPPVPRPDGGRFHPRPFAAMLMRLYRFYASGDRRSGDFHRYDPQAGIWRDDADAFLDAVLRTGDILPAEWRKRTHIEEIIADVRGLVWHAEPMPEADPHLIPFANGVYDLRNGTLSDPTPEDYLRVHLPWRYDPEAQSVLLRRRLDAHPTHIRQHFLELLAYCLWRNYPLQRFFLWVGRGATGKSYLARLLTFALGEENIASVSLQEIADDGFAASRLYNKLANIAGETSYRMLEDTNRLKQITGGDLIEANRKYREPVRFRNYAKLLFLTNSLPETADHSTAFFRRAFIVQFTQCFEEDPSIDAELELLVRTGAVLVDGVRVTADVEFAWLLTQAVHTLRELVSRGFAMTGDMPAEQKERLYRDLSDPLMTYVDERCTITGNPDDAIPKWQFAESFADWCRERGYVQYGDRRLGLAMKRIGVGDGQRTHDGKRWWCWLGIKWRDAARDAQHAHHVGNRVQNKSENSFEHPVHPVHPVQQSFETDPFAELFDGACIMCGRPAVKGASRCIQHIEEAGR